MKIWVYLNGIQQGPYTIEQLKLMPIDSNTPVWFEGMAQWMPVGNTSLAAQLFGDSQTPDSTPTTGSGTASEAREISNEPIAKRPPTYLVWNIVLTVLCCSPVSLAGIITGALSSSRYASGDIKGAERLSNATEWLVIISIVWVILSAPLSLLFI